ncbi:hypothetical protein ORI20_18380 [Mycobacterium sp. CVI_P3]|uniref:Transmembrane protein n=1 Tax=Mycobacterium pinniadriaticum TaxID=2994102 RepID=A0ABT3SGK8_9MYCO|nr:hypothetical protein [Mycobacterium pinniadriaticum]MCX2932244.1 hypothetical protein [Mycobacterium pinniadriaticum]MCX2938656.1 hypothetical protein [Mycobacterium pinniadriaticum]
MGIADIALGAAPIAGGALLGVAAGNLKTPDIRALIKQDQDLLERIPPEQVERRAELQGTIDMRIDDVIAGIHRNREIRAAAASYTGNWRDIVVFICAVLFTVVWWNVPHSRSNWLVMFIALIILSAVVALYASRGIIRALASMRRSRHHEKPASGS